MRPLQNILDLYQYTAIMGEGKDPHSFLACWDDCVLEVEKQILQDCTTTKDNLHEKAKNYALNYIANRPVQPINKDDYAQDVADEVERAFQDKCFDQRPPASVAAQNAQKSIPEDPEKRFIKLG